MRALIIFCVLGTAAALNAIPPQPRDVSENKQPQRIVGGIPTDIRQYPFMANIEYSFWGDSWMQLYGGSLITPTAVLSAAHCFYLELPIRWRIRLGSTSVNSGGSLHFVTQLIFHPEYSHVTLINDVAILRLTTPAVLSNTIGLARLSGPAYNLIDNSVAHIVGWGRLRHRDPYPDVLHDADVTIINQEVCVERYAYLKSQPGYQRWPDVTEEMLCAGILDDGSKGGCQGDYGGPVVQNGVVVGIMSWHHYCADPLYPTVYTRVSVVTDFIVPNAL